MEYDYDAYEGYKVKDGEAVARIAKLDPSRIIVLDTETTGLKKTDVVLSLSIVDGNGKVLFDHLIRPEKRRSWPEATKIHGIKWKDVESEKELEEYSEELLDIFDPKKVSLIVGYNLEYDLKMLEQSGAYLHVPESLRFDVMREYARFAGRRRSTYGGRLFTKLEQCAKHYGHAFEPHGSLADTLATLACFKALIKDAKYLAAVNEREEKLLQAKERIKEQQREAEMRAERERVERIKEQQREERERQERRKDTVLAICLVLVPIILVAAFIAWLYNR